MIYTITFNPALDYMVSVPDFCLGRTNQTQEEILLPGGKGVNVSVVLKNLGYDSVALGFIAGFTGAEIRRRMEDMGCMTRFITVPNGMSRINMKLKSVEGTEIHGTGPKIDPQGLQELMKQLDTMRTGDILVLAGSIPAGISDSIYQDMMSQVEGKGILTVVDATKNLLVNVLHHRPFLIKPNHHELGEIFEVEIKQRDEAIFYAKKIQEMGARNVLVSMAHAGAVLVDETGRVHESPAPGGHLVNAVGAGDSMVAGFLVGWMESGKYEHAFEMGIVCGSASAFSEFLATRIEVEALLKQWKSRGLT